MEVQYALIWPRATLNELATAWLAAPDRDAVTEASHLIEDDKKVRVLRVWSL